MKGERKSCGRWQRELATLLLLLLIRPALAADEVDISKLPPPATNHIEFSRDIKPILDASCLRCHGPERQKSAFRLDTRDAALKGGDKGKDILPGDSAKSPFIRYVANLVEDMEMPPTGKGDPLTPAQIGLLRAWIDQGVTWDTVQPTNVTSGFVSLLMGGTEVDGDNHKFREHFWRKEGPFGGVEEFELFNQYSKDTSILITGHALPEDYKINFAVDKNQFGFIHTGWEQYRKYYDDTGGFRPTASTPAALSLQRDLHLDIGKAWIDFGLTLPDLPRMVLGYEYDYRKGIESDTSWGAAGTGADVRNLAPESKKIQEAVHRIKFDLDADVKGFTLEERFRGEFYQLATSYTNRAARNSTTDNAKEGNSYFEGANTIRAEKQFNDWFYASAGYLFSKLDGDATFNDSVLFVPSGKFYNSSVPQITLERKSHVANVSTLLGPFDDLTISLGAESEWTQEHSFGNGLLNSIGYTFTAPLTLNVTNAALLSDYAERSVSEYLALRYTKIPRTVLFAEARMQQQDIGQLDQDFQATGNFYDNTSFTSRLYDLRAGFNTSPWRAVAFTVQYHRYDNNSDYQTNQIALPIGGYPGFIRSRELLTDAIETKLVLHPCSSIKTTLSYQYLTTRYSEITAPAFNAVAPGAIYSPGGELLAGRTDSMIYSLGASWTPTARLYLDGTVSYQPSTTLTMNAGSPSIAPYTGNTYMAVANTTFVLSEKSDLFAGYAFSKATYGQFNQATVVPVGIDYQMHNTQVGITHRFNKMVSTKLQYQFSYYEEPSSGGANNYRAHSIFATMNIRFR